MATDSPPEFASGNRPGCGRALPDSNERLLPQFRKFLAEYRLRLCAISALVVVPCFWHRRIAASDLGSHLYNAWLVQLIARGDVTDMHVARQWTNVLFDYMLSAASAFVSLHTAERIVVPIVVLLFFWGSFAMAAAAARRAPWFLTPLIALATYGWTFHLGLFNYYISIGLAFWGIAIFWRGRGWERCVPPALAPLIVLAHPLGLLWMIAGCAYVGIAELLPLFLQWGLALVSAGIVYAMRLYILHRFGIQDSLGSIVKFNGADQVVLFGNRYYLLKAAVIAAVLVMLLVEILRRVRARESWQSLMIPLQLYAVIEFAVSMLPSGVTISPDLAAVAILTERLTSVAAIIACCILSVIRPQKWHLALTGAIAAVFFAWVYQDSGTINRVELQAERLVRTLPRDSRVMATIFAPNDSRILIQHIIDRACIDWCFDYGNYEPGTGLFRVRGDQGGYYNLGDYGLAVDMEEGTYVVQPEDLPLTQVYQCSKNDWTNLCITPLHAGEENDSMGLYGKD